MSSTILRIVSCAWFFSMRGAIIIFIAIFSIAGVFSTGWIVGSFTAIFSPGYVVIVMTISLRAVKEVGQKSNVRSGSYHQDCSEDKKQLHSG